MPKIPKLKFPLKPILSHDMDSDEYELLINLKTKNKIRAMSRAQMIIGVVNMSVNVPLNILAKYQRKSNAKV